MAEARRGKSQDDTTTVRTFKKGERISVEVIAREGQRLTLRIVDTGQELVHEALYPPPWKPGERKRVVIELLETDRRVKKIRP